MIRQAGQVSRACTASTRPVPWPLDARLALHPRNSRSLHTPADVSPTAGPADSDPAFNDVPPTPPPKQEIPEHRASGPGQPQRSQQILSKDAQREANWGRLGPHQPPNSLNRKWTYPPTRLSSYRHSLYARRISGKTFDTLMSQFQGWDFKMKTVFDRLNGVERTPSSPKPPTWAERTLEELLASDTVEDMRSSWLAIPQENRQTKQWLAIMKAALDSRLDRMAMLLEATVETDIAPSWAVPDVFSALAIWHAKLPKDSQQRRQTHLPRLLLHLLRNSPPNQYRFQQFALGLTLSTCKPDVVAEIYSALQAHDHPLHWNTKLQIAGRLAKQTKHKLAALRLFESLFDDPEVDVNGRRCAALATDLFALPEGWEDRRSPVEVQLLAEAFERVVGRGLSPNMITFTAMIRALCLTNQLDAAWKIYEVMRNSRSTPTPHTFSILLNGAKRALSLDSAIRVVEEATPEALQAPYIWNDLVHIILLAAEEELPSSSAGENPIPLTAFPTMLQAYSKFFDLKPLQKLIPAGSPDPADDSTGLAWKEKLGPLIDQLPVSPPDRLVEPDVDTLGIMLTGYIKSLPSTNHVISFYSHFRSLVYNRDPLALRLVKHSTLPYDLVLGFISTRSGMLGVAVDIVKRMLRDAIGSTVALEHGLTEPDPEELDPEELDPEELDPEELDPEELDPEEPGQSNGLEESSVGTLPAYYHPPPSVYTWTILVQTFCLQANPEAAMRMIQTMRRHGVQPNHVTWHTLLGSYARRQRVAPVMAVLDELDRAGYPPSRHTIRAVAKLHNHDAILTRLDERAGLRDKSLWDEVEAAAAPEPSPRPTLSFWTQLRLRRARARRMWRQMEKERLGLAPPGAIITAPGDEEPWERLPWERFLQREKELKGEEVQDKESRGKESRDKKPEVEKPRRIVRDIREEPETQGVSDAQLDAYLRMYDDLVFMRMGEETDIFSEPFVKGVGADKSRKPERTQKPRGKTVSNSQTLRHPPQSGLGLHLGPAVPTAGLEAADMPEGSG